MAERATTPIEDYALIGDCETAALVSRDGSVDWLCWPRFDSPACFAALLGAPEHGRWRIAPRDVVPERTHRQYRGDTLVLETVMETAEGGAVALIDFMPPRDGRSDLVRIVRGLRGRVPMRMELVLRFDYGRTVPWVTRNDDADLRAVAGPHQVVLRTDVPTRGENLHTVAEFEVGEGEEAVFVLTHSPSHLPPPEPADPRRQLGETEAFWTDWISACSQCGHWSAAVRRSLLTLKALTYRPTGGIVAAPTTSLPEVLGGSRNWDYRFCWLRDSALLLTALTGAGFLEEAAAWRDWLVRAVAGSPDQVQIMYGVAGERLLTETELPWLPGYAGSRPVRIGNGAAGQLQLDVLGEVIDSLFQALQRGLGRSATGWALARAIMGHLEGAWRQPDHGIWEVRGPPRHFTHSKVMVWVAFDRVVRAVEALSLDAPVERWRRVRDEVHAEVCERGFDPELGAFTQSYGSRSLDASLLQIPLVGFLPADDPRVRGTVAAIERGLVSGGLVQRYDPAATDDGLERQDEGAFLACSFWLVEAMLLDGRGAEARALFERLLALSNDVGLLAEEYDERAGRQVGNFPQAFSHVALVNAALALAGAENPDRSAPPPQQRQG
ncbi:MAG: Glucoamylase [uncultured Acetobacteraceae bacterium]|uniref:Trehalase n=1 Tax=uncultured Acetobacteraceae bacterium TaxID=169975 RepID=A0A6J4JD21_9PROT|nr:MAG: Glucoamylase [uncultured Acetobacteraceae bacterium]